MAHKNPFPAAVVALLTVGAYTVGGIWLAGLTALLMALIAIANTVAPTRFV